MDTHRTPFRLLDLPIEIRDHIYTTILCDFDPPIDIDDNIDNEVSQAITFVKHDIETTILLANRQIYREAKEVMLKTNRFVRVETRGIPIVSMLSSKCVPIVSMDRNLVSRFQGFVMRHNFSESSDSDDSDQESMYSPYFNLMLLRRDLPAFCAALADADVFIDDFAMHTQHTVTLLNPFGETKHTSQSVWNSVLAAHEKDDACNCRWKYPSLQQQEHLVSPYRILRGFSAKDFRLGGCIDSSLAESIQQTICLQADLDPEAFLALCTTECKLGETYFEAANFHMASDIWHRAAKRIYRQIGSKDWHEFIARSTPEILPSLTDLFFTWNMHLATIDIRELEKNAHRLETAQAHANSAVRALRRAAHAAVTLGAEWVPSSGQKAELYRKNAVVVRLLGSPGHLEAARRMVRLALEEAPDDEEILREEAEVEEWATRLGR